jgi:hypothetical protein
MPQPASSAVPTLDVYLLFAYEPYYPGPGVQEVNTAVVAAAFLLHPKVRRSDGARIHDLHPRVSIRRGHCAGHPHLRTERRRGLAEGRRLGGRHRRPGPARPAGRCDVLGLGLPEIARTWLCIGPHSHVRACDAAGDDFLVYGPAEREAVVAEVGVYRAELVAVRALWAGDGLLPPLVDHG